MIIKQTYLTNNECYQRGEHLTVKGLMLHSVGCGFSSAEGFVKSWNKPNFYACVHGFIDSNTGEVYQTLPWNMRGWHAGGSANNTHIGVEMCESEYLNYIPNTAEFSIDIQHIPKARNQLMIAYDSAVKLFADLCLTFGLDPLADGVIISHNEGGKRGVASNHVDPEHVWRGLGLPYTMDGFRKDVKKTMDGIKFVDVPKDAYYYDAVKWGVENNIIKGVDDTHFNPAGQITRADAITILYRFSQYLHK